MTEPRKIDLAAALATFDEPWSPRIVGRYNDNKVFLAKAKGEFVWHSHPDTDDLFLVLEGRLTIQLRERNVDLGPGELFVVPRGAEHCPRSDKGASILLIEPKGRPTQAIPPPPRRNSQKRPDMRWRAMISSRFRPSSD